VFPGNAVCTGGGGLPLQGDWRRPNEAVPAPSGTDRFSGRVPLQFKASSHTERARRNAPAQIAATSARRIRQCRLK